MKNVALVGQMGAGKTTLAEGLILNGHYARLSLAGPLKDIASRVYGPIEKGGEYETISREGTRVSKSGRQILQEVGQYMKYVDRDFWVKAAINTAKRHAESSDAPLVCEDTRFKFEAQTFRDNGWLIVGITTPEAIRVERYKTLYGREPRPEELNHESEVEVPAILDEADILVDGTADVDETVRNIISAAA